MVDETVRVGYNDVGDGEQKIRELADTNHRQQASGIRDRFENRKTAAGYLLNYKSGSQEQLEQQHPHHHRYEEEAYDEEHSDERDDGKESSNRQHAEVTRRPDYQLYDEQKRWQLRQQQHSSRAVPQVNSGKQKSDRKTNAGTAQPDSDSLNESQEAHHRSDHYFVTSTVSLTSVATPFDPAAMVESLSAANSSARRRDDGSDGLDGAVVVNGRIDEAMTQTIMAQGYGTNENVVPATLQNDDDVNESIGSIFHRLEAAFQTSDDNDKDISRVRRSNSPSDDDDDDDDVNDDSNRQYPVVSEETKFNSVKKTMTLAAGNNESSNEIRAAVAAKSEMAVPSTSKTNEISKDQSVVFSSGDISKSDIRYNNNTFSSHSKTSYSSLSSSSSSSVPSLSYTAAVVALSPSLSSLKVTTKELSQKERQQRRQDQSVSASSISNSLASLATHPDVVENVSTVNYRKSEIRESVASKLMSDEQIIIIDDGGEEFQTRRIISEVSDENGSNDYVHDEPRALPLRPIIRGPYDDDSDDDTSIQYADQHSEFKLICEVDLDTISSVWFKNGQIVETVDKNARPTDYRFIREPLGGLTIRNVMLEDDAKWQCRASNTNGYEEDARPVRLIVLDRPKAPYLLIDSRRLDAGNIFVPVKENSELNLACISEGGNPKPTLSWEVLLSPGVDRHAQKVAAEVLELEEIKSEKDKEPYKINSGAKSEARLPAVYRAHHNARILCVMEHPTLKMRQNASLLLDVQYTPSFAISRTPGFGYPLREGIEVSLKCDVDSNPPSTPIWQKDDGDTPVPQTGDGFLNFTSIRREHSGWYKCSSRHLNFQYSSIGYYLSVRYDSVDVTSEPDDQEVSVAASHNPNKGQLEVQLGGAVTLQCPQGSLGCWSHLDPVTARLRGLGIGLNTPTGQFSLKDVVYQDAGTYKCIGQSTTNKKKLEVLQTIGLYVKGAPTAVAKNATPVAYPGSPLHLAVEFCANPPAYAARWLHGDRVYTPGNQYGSTVLAYGVTDQPTPFCKEARLTYVSMHERVPRTFYFIVSSAGGIAEAVFKVNFTLRYKTMGNSVDEEEEELSEPEEIHFPVFGSSSNPVNRLSTFYYPNLSILLAACFSFCSWYRIVFSSQRNGFL